MTLLVPIGLLGLLGIVALIIIYIIKPNYQQKFISSTFVWKLSLKYRKRRIPTSKLRNILIIICQVLILASLAFILARPATVLKEDEKNEEVVAIIDSSASMRAVADSGVSRYERAVSEVGEMADRVFARDGTVSVILADNSPRFLSNRITGDMKSSLAADLADLVDMEDASEDKEMLCSYGGADIDKAMNLCQEIVNENPNAKIYLYTDKEYEYTPLGVNVVNVSDESEWNAAILNAYSEIVENTHVFTVEMAVFGNLDMTVSLTVNVYGANAADENDDGTNFTYEEDVRCYDNNVITVVFRYGDDGIGDDIDNFVNHSIDINERAYTFKYAHISIDADDSFKQDNNIDIYGGEKETLRVLYASPLRNNFIPSVIDGLRANALVNYWQIELDEPMLTNTTDYAPPTEGYDVYIYEHRMPDSLPTDGVVFLFDPDKSPIGADFKIENVYQVPDPGGIEFVEDMLHPILSDVDCSMIHVTRFTRLGKVDAYDVLAVLDGSDYPMLLSRNDGDVKIFVMPFSVHYSDIAISEALPQLFLNAFRYFIPATIAENSFEVYESVTLNARGESLSVTGYKVDEVFSEFPAKLTLTTPGTYTISQTTYFGKEVTEKIFARVPASESNIFEKGDTFNAPYVFVDESDYYRDWLLYLEIALVALLFAEWILHLRESM